MYGMMEIEADSLEEAVEIANSDEQNLPEGSYVEASFEVDEGMLDFENQ